MQFTMHSWHSGIEELVKACRTENIAKTVDERVDTFSINFYQLGYPKAFVVNSY